MTTPPPEEPAAPRVRIRPSRSEDREAVRHLCCETGYFGQPIDRVFSDRKWFADFHTNYYLRHEHDSCFVAEAEGRIIGYILGCRHPRKFFWVYYPLVAVPLVLKALGKSLLGLYDQKSRLYIKRLILSGSRERPRRPRHTPHFHFNVEAGSRNRGVGRALIRELFRHFLKNGVEQVYGELLHAEKLRDESFYTSHGFRFYDRRPTSLGGEEFGKISWITVIARILDTRDIFRF
ncbi:MAG: GNAT family N-acetyltransferase [Candidatus Aminicenantales bacterium]